MRTLIAVKSCFGDRRQGCHKTIRETWGKGLNLKFFLGTSWESYKSDDDEISLNCPDDYDSLPKKTQSICQWSVASGYEYTFLCDVDTFLIPSKLFKTGYEDYDYSGRFGNWPKIGVQFPYKDGRGIHHPKCYSWASGGFGYFLSYQAAQAVSLKSPYMWAEDMQVSDILSPLVVKGQLTAADLKNFENEASWHYPAHRLGWNRETMQEWMRKMFEEHK